MRIAVDALGISQPGGGRSATLNLLQPLLDMDQDNEYLVFLDRPEPCLEGYGNLRQIIAPFGQRLATRAWAQITWPTLLRREGVQVIHHTKNLTTFASPCASVVTIHDLTILVHPEVYPRFDVAYWRTIEPFCLRHVDRIIAVSPITARDLMRYYDIPAQRIETICEGIDDLFKPAQASEVSRVRAKYRLPESYLLHVGSISPKKNLATLARAYARLVRQGDFEGALLLVGRSYWKGGDRALDEFIAQKAPVGRIIRTGPVPQKDLPGLYTGATCFVFPSLHEGFGLVPLEALACGTPVVATRVGVLEDMIADAAVFLDDPRDDAALAKRIGELLRDDGLRERLRVAGLCLAPSFSRKQAARRTLDLYKSLAAGREP